jgi:sporulation protein YlmC with PRC-barrel domain
MPKKSKKKTTFSLNSILKKQVIDANGEVIGSVEDIIVTVGGDKPEALLSMRDGEGKETQVSFTDISAISEVVLLSKDIAKGTKAMKPAKAFAPTKPKKGATVPPPPPSTSPATKKCSQCGFENRADSKFCIKCGNKLA